MGKFHHIVMIGMVIVVRGKDTMKKTRIHIIGALKYYIPIKYWILNDWNKIVNREEEVEENVFKYKCSFFTLYFNEKLEPITYGKQHIINNTVFYDTNVRQIGAMTYTPLGSVEWYKKYGWVNE